MSTTARLLTAAFLLALAAPVQADVLNGSFENGAPQPAPGMFLNLSAGSTAITGWTVIASDIDWGNNGFASDGTHGLDLNGHDGPGGVSQVLTTVPGQLTRLLFDMNANTPLTDPTARTLTVSAAGTSQSYTYDPTLEPGRPWVTYSFAFLATGPSTTVSFLSTSSDQYFGPGVDNVRQEVPEPGTAALLATLVPLGFWLRKRKKAVFS